MQGETRLEGANPYQFLNRLNQVYRNEARSTVNDYSSASIIKLPFKQFNPIKVPECFEIKYAQESQNSLPAQESEHPEADDWEKKLWKDHQQIIKRHFKKEPVHFKRRTQKHQATQGSKNDYFLRKIMQKSNFGQYDRAKLEGQVIRKLKQISDPQQHKKRAQTAKVSLKPVMEINLSQAKQNSLIKQDQFLTTSGNELIDKYRSIVKNVDCSLSAKIIKQTNLVINQLNSILKFNGEFL